MVKLTQETHEHGEPSASIRVAEVVVGLASVPVRAVLWGTLLGTILMALVVLTFVSKYTFEITAWLELLLGPGFDVGEGRPLDWGMPLFRKYWYVLFAIPLVVMVVEKASGRRIAADVLGLKICMACTAGFFVLVTGLGVLFSPPVHGGSFRPMFIVMGISLGSFGVGSVGALWAVGRIEDAILNAMRRRAANLPPPLPPQR